MEDKISQLPDEILQHILTFIDIYEAVETTILSKRWKSLWRSLPSLRFHLSRAASHRRVTLTNEQDTIDFSPRFVSHFLSHRDATAPVHDFHLSLDTISNPYTDDHGKEWFAGLPKLEKLSLRGYQMIGLVLKAPKLRVLEIFDSFLGIQEIHAPLLTSFRYEACLPLECSMMNLPKLKEVYLDIHRVRYDWKLFHLQCVRLLHQLGNATTVTLTLDSLKFLEDSIEQGPPPFPNIKILKMIKGRHETRTILKRVLNYLTKNFEF